MDQFEKKLKGFYLEKKQEDEKSIPGFDTFRDKLEPKKRARNSYIFLKVAASVVLAVVTGSYYFYASQRPTATEAIKIYPVDITPNLPTQSLLNKNAGAGYIWTWKAETDQLLEDATKSSKTEL